MEGPESPYLSARRVRDLISRSLLTSQGGRSAVRRPCVSTAGKSCWPQIAVTYAAPEPRMSLPVGLVIQMLQW